MENNTLHETKQWLDMETENKSLDELKHVIKEEEQCASVETNLHTEEAMPDVTTHAMNVATILLCNPCLFDDSEEGAVGFCVSCVEYLCQGCCRDHKKSKATRHHKIIRDNLPEDASMFRLMKEMTSCSKHPDTQVSHKCEDHKEYVCVMCIAGGHRKCEHVMELEKERNDNGKNLMEAAAETLDAIQVNSKLIAQTRKENMETLVKEKIEIQKTNASLLQQIYDNLSILEQNAIIMSENVTESELSYLGEDIEICSDLEKERIKFAQLLDTVKQHCSSTEIVVITDGLRDKISGLHRILEKQQQKGYIHLRFKQNPSLSRISTLGRFKVYRGDTPIEDKTHCIEGSSDEIVEQDDLPSASLDTKVANTKDETKEKPNTKRAHKSRKTNKKAKKYPIRVSGDVFDCSITGIVILQDGRVVVIDQENRKIKVFSSGSCKPICSLSLESKPVDICQIGPKDFAVVYKDMKLIDKYTVDGKTVKLERSWKTKYLNVGITMDRELYVVLCRADGNKAETIRIQVRRDTDCKVLLEASIYEAEEGEIEWDGCSICSTGGEIVVASKSLGISIFRRNKVESLETIRTLNAYDDTSLNLRGLTTDKDANLYVCSSSSTSVYQIAAKEYSVMMPIASGIDRPTAVTVSRKKDRVFIGCQNNNYLHVFDMKQ